MDVCDSLIKWLKTFSVAIPGSTIDELMDGVTMSHVLHQICPRHFTEAWMGSIKQDLAANDWRLKVSNLKKVLKKVLEFYTEILEQQVNDNHLPDVNAIVEKKDEHELGRLLQLILGCAVNCDDKHEYIRQIMSMEETVQHDVMKAIQDLMSKEVHAVTTEATVSSESEEYVKKLLEDIQNLTEQKEENAQRCHDLDLQIVLLEEDKGKLLLEIDRLNDRLNQVDDPSSVAGRRYIQLQKQAQQLQEELYRVETSRDELRVSVEVLQKEITDLQEKNEELEEANENMRQMKDEIEILRVAAEKVARQEAAIATYKKKLEELSDLKGQLKILESNNMEYMQKNLDLEEELKKAEIVKNQMDSYKRQVQDLQSKLVDETKRADKFEFDAKRSQEKLASLQLEKERLTEELKSSQQQYNELVCAQSLPGNEMSGDVDVPDTAPTTSSLLLMSLPPETRQRILRLERENQQLKMQATSSEDSSLLRGMLDDAQKRCHMLECEVRSANQRVLELEANLNDLNEVQQKRSENESSTTAEVKKRLTEQVERCRHLEAELLKQQKGEEELETKLQLTISELQAEIAKKESELKETEEKYKRYLKKAETLIRSQIDPKTSQPGSIMSAELATVKSQLDNKDQYVKLVEQENEKIRSSRELEEKLMVTAWYNYTTSLHRKAAEDRLTALSSSSAGPNSPQSFLARQRQVHIRRQPGSSLVTSSTPNTAR